MIHLSSQVESLQIQGLMICIDENNDTTSGNLINLQNETMLQNNNLKVIPDNEVSHNLQDDPFNLQINNTMNSNTFDKNLQNKSKDLENNKTQDLIYDSQGVIQKDKVIRESNNYIKATPKHNRKRFNTIAKQFNTSAKKSRIEVNLAFESLKKQHSKRTVLSKNQGSIKSFNSLQLLDKAIHSDEDKVEKKRSTTNLGTKAQVPDTNLIEHVDNLNPEEAKEEGKSLHENQEDKKSIQSFGPKEINLEDKQKQIDKCQNQKQQECRIEIEEKKIKDKENRSTDGDSNFENKILIQFKENEILDDELKVINKIYDRFYVNQKLPNKERNDQFRTKYFKFIPRNPLMKQETQYIRDKSGKKVKKSCLTAEEKRMRKIMDQKYKERNVALKENYLKILSEKIQGKPKRQSIDEFSKNLANPAFKYLGLIYKSTESEQNKEIIESGSGAINQLIESEERQNLNSTQTVFQKVNLISNTKRNCIKQRGASQDLGALPSTKYASMNFNRFQYLYNFKNETQEDEIKPNNSQLKITNSEITVCEDQISQFDKSKKSRCSVTVDQILNNPCIFNIRERLMSNKLPDAYCSSVNSSKMNTSRMKENKNIRNSLNVSCNSVRNKNNPISRFSEVPKHMNKKTKDKYLKMLVGQEEFLPKLISSRVTPSSSLVINSLEEDVTVSRDNLRQNRVVNRRLNFSAACKIYLNDQQSDF